MTSLREQKKRATARALADAAYALALERGFDAVTTDDIASRADVSRRTFANYYVNKNAAVVDGFVQHLGITIWRPDDPADPTDLPGTFEELMDSTQEFIAGVFTESGRIEHIQEFAKMVKNNPALEPYIHAVFLEFQNSSSHQILAERFGGGKMSMFLGAVIGSLSGIIRLILGPLAIPRDTPALRGITARSPSAEPEAEEAPVLSEHDVQEILTHIDLAFTYLRDGFVDHQRNNQCIN